MNFVTPSGFRDVLTDEAVLREQAAQAVQANMAAKGYLPVETPTLEVMDVLQAGGRLPGTPFKLFDARGDLLAMRPDVTLQIARMCATRLAGQPGPFRFRYMQRVFREAEGQTRAEPRETTQMGVELIGQAGAAADAEVVGLLAESLKLAGVADFKIALASVSVLRALLASCGAAPQWRQAVLDAYHTSNFVTLDELTSGEGAQGVPPVFAQAIGKLARIRGGRAVIAEVRELVAPLGCETGLDGLEQAFDLLEAAGLADSIQVDFSVMSSFDYYTGIVFEAYAPGLGSPLGSGGRYDNTIVRPSDAPAFVELGAADCGICGEDSLLEAQPEVVELADLKFGSCRFVVAEPAGAADQTAEHYRRLGSIRIATKYPNITRAHYAKTGTQVEIVKLHGNIELAPLTGLAERIVDITATGTTLRENNLVIVEDVLSSTARFFANGTSLRTDARIVELADAMRAGAAAGKWEATVIAGGVQSPEPATE